MQFRPTETFDEQVTELTSRVSGPISEMTFVDQSLLFSELSILAYCQPGFAAEWATKLGFPSATRTFTDEGLVSYVFVNHDDVVIAFRGMDMRSTENVDEVLDFELVPDGPNGLVHDGFRQALSGVWPITQPMVTAFSSQRKVWLTGHSMGGAMAVVLAARAIEKRVPITVEGIFSFGSPRVGTRAYVRSINTPHARWVNHKDLVANLPFSMFGYGYRHHGKEHYIDSDGQIEETLFGRCWRSILTLVSRWLKHSLEDHSIFAYRAHLVRSQQEVPIG